jgi:hypothetical protein
VLATVAPSSLGPGLLALLGFFAIAAAVADLPEYAAGFKQFLITTAGPGSVAAFLANLSKKWQL